MREARIIICLLSFLSLFLTFVLPKTIPHRSFLVGLDLFLAAFFLYAHYNYEQSDNIFMSDLFGFFIWGFCALIQFLMIVE